MPADVEVGVPRADRGARRLRLSLPRAMLVAIATYGAVGLILALVLLAGLLRLATTAGGLAHEQDSLVQVTQSSRAAALDGQAAAQRAEAGVTATADAADRAAGFVRELATALRQTADGLRVDVFGSQPFAAAADRVAGAADQADQTSTGLSEAANQARAGATQLHAVTADLGRIADDLDAVAHGLSAGGGLDDASLAVLEIALVGLLAWLAVPAGVCVWLGFTLWRRPAVRPRSAPRRAPVR